jgi:hypothetical protein
MADIYTERDDAACDALAQRLAAACQGVADPDVLVELVAILGEFIGHYPIDQRASLIVGAGAQLRQYVSEIPPLASDDPESLD